MRPAAPLRSWRTKAGRFWCGAPKRGWPRLKKAEEIVGQDLMDICYTCLIAVGLEYYFWGLPSMALDCANCNTKRVSTVKIERGYYQAQKASHESESTPGESQLSGG